MKKCLSLPSIGFVLALLVLSQSGCAGPTTATKSAGSSADFAKLSGKVVETANAGGYTYICLEKDGKKTWAAVPTMKVQVGDELKLMPGAEMTGFPSKALDRTFDKIIFSAGPEQAATARPAADEKSVETKAFEKPVLAGKVVETMDAKGYTYICLEKDGRKGWSAVPSTQVKVGDEIELIPGSDMGQFTSSGLRRTFDNIHFSGGIKGVEADKNAPSHHAMNSQASPAQTAAIGTATAALPGGHPALKPQESPAKTAAPPISGKVVETMDSGGYSYICLEKDGKKVWVAAPAMKVALGDQLSFRPGSDMPNFNSKSLNRTFEKINFSGGPVAL